MLSRKGISMVVVGIVGVLIFIALMIVLVVIWFSEYLDIHEMVVESTVEGHALNLGQVILASPRLAYQDGIFVHRGIFEKNKIEEQLNPGSELTSEVGYPNSIIVIGVKDFENPDQTWQVKFKGRWSLSGTKTYTFLNCLWEQIEIEPRMIFKPTIFWDIYDVAGCIQAEVSNYGTATRVFPVAIKDGDDIHSGALYVTVQEAWTPETVFEAVSGD